MAVPAGVDPIQTMSARRIAGQWAVIPYTEPGPADTTCREPAGFRGRLRHVIRYIAGGEIKMSDHATPAPSGTTLRAAVDTRTR